MATTLRELLIRQGARLQGRPALSTPAWGTVSFAQLRNRVEGVAFGLLAGASAPAWFSATGTPWDWVAELAIAASGLRWDPAAQPLSPEILGGERFNAEAGRGPYHGREAAVEPGTPFTPAFSHGEWLLRLRRLNVRLGWDHETVVHLPLDDLGAPGVRGALWSCLFAGGHATLRPGPPGPGPTSPELDLQAGLWVP